MTPIDDAATAGATASAGEPVQPATRESAASAAIGDTPAPIGDPDGDEAYVEDDDEDEESDDDEDEEPLQCAGRAVTEGT